MNKEKIIRKILAEVLEENKKEISRISLTDDLTEHGLDSISAINMIVQLEEKFGIEIIEDDLLVENVSTIEKIINVINKYL